MDYQQCTAKGGNFTDGKCVMPTKAARRLKKRYIIGIPIFLIAIILTILSFINKNKIVTSTIENPNPLEWVYNNAGIFFDHFGILIFAFLIWIGISDLTENLRPTTQRWMSWGILCIGLAGIIVDGGLVFINLLK